MANKHGKGVFRLPNGMFYDGEWEDDKRHGVFVTKDKTGKERKGNEKGFSLIFWILELV